MPCFVEMSQPPPDPQRDAQLVPTQRAESASLVGSPAEPAQERAVVTADPSRLLDARTRLSIVGARLNAALEDTLQTVLGEKLPNQRSRALYAKDLRAFFEYAAERGPCRLPASPDLVADFLIAQVEPQRRRAAFPKVQAMNRCATAISTLHRVLELENPCRSTRVHEIRVGLRHQWGYRASSAGRFGPDLLLQAVSGLTDDDLATLRDRALFLIAFAAGLGPADIQHLAVGHLRWEARLLTIDLGGTVARIEREDADFAALCPLRALEAWLAASGIAAGPIFRPVRLAPIVSGRPAAACPPMTYQGLAQIFKSRLKAAGIPTSQHNVGSFRVGFLSSAYGIATGPFKPQHPIRLSRFYP